MGLESTPLPHIRTQCVSLPVTHTIQGRPLTRPRPASQHKRSGVPASCNTENERACWQLMEQHGKEIIEENKESIPAILEQNKELATVLILQPWAKRRRTS